VAKLQIKSVPSDELRELSAPELARTLYVHRVGFSIVFGIVLALGILLSLMPRKYRATASLWVEPGQSSSLAVADLASTLSGQQSSIVASEVLALQSRTLTLRVAKELDLVNNGDFWGGWMAFLSEPDPGDRTLDNAKTRDLVYKRMTHILDIENDGKDEVIYVNAETISPKLSAMIVNTLVNDYLAYLLEMRFGANQRASVWLTNQLGDLKKQIDKDQTELISLQEKLGIVGMEFGSATYLPGQSLGDLMKASDEAKVQRIIAEAKLRFLRASDPNLIEGEIQLLPQPSDVGTSQQSLLATLRASRAQASGNLSRLLSQFGPNYIEVKQQKAQLDQIDKEVTAEQNRILNQAQLSYDAASAHEKMADGNLERNKAQVFDSHDNMARYALLAQDYGADRSLYMHLIEQMQTAGITSGLQAADIDVTDLADIPGKPIILGPLVYLPGSIILGLICGTFFAFWLGSLDRRVRGPEHIEKLTGLSLLSQLPHIKREKKIETDAPHKLPSVIPPLRSHYSEALQSLRAAILLSRPGSAPRVILITSSVPGEGKSTTTINLGAMFARHGARVLICDCDLRRGLIAKRLNMSAAKGLTSVLTRQTSLDAAIEEYPGLPGLYVLPDGPRAPDPAVLIGSEEMRRFVEACREKFDFIFLDSPPVLGIADGLQLGQNADAAILVIREGVSNTKAVKESVAKMTAANLAVAGFVYNDVDPRASRYEYGYAYGAYAKYYADPEEPEIADRKEV
jgi:polysaccharide biosynthesis transport protein